MSEISSEESTRTLSSDFLPKHATRSAVENIRTLEKKCFIGNEIRTVKKKAYINGGLARITPEDTADKIQDGKI